MALIAAGIVFCYMTQLSRYILHQKFDIHGVRIVQRTPFVVDGDPTDGSWTGSIEPVDTHLFLNGGEDDASHERLDDHCRQYLLSARDLGRPTGPHRLDRA